MRTTRDLEDKLCIDIGSPLMEWWRKVSQKRRAGCSHSGPWGFPGSKESLNDWAQVAQEVLDEQ